MGPLQHASECSGAQAPLCHPRSRACLLQGCGRQFTHPCGRVCYCSEECRRAARKWSGHEAQQRYRSSEQGRSCRREQSRRWRQRQREKPPSELPARPGEALAEPSEGHQLEPSGKKIRCHRPGCSATFVYTARSPLRRFCGASCRQALRRVRVRDARWRAACPNCPLRTTRSCGLGPRGP